MARRAHQEPGGDAVNIDERRRIRDERARRIAAMNLEGLTDYAIAKRLDINVKTVRDALDRPARELRGPT